MRGLWAASILLISATASAAPRVRFEPTDLELEDTGVLDVDLQIGTFRGNPSRKAVLDGELDLGLREDIELDLDFAFYRVEERYTADPLWLSLKLGFVDAVDQDTHRGWAVGAQLGPRLHPMEHPRGVGYEGLFLFGRVWPALQLVLNTGLIYDAPTRETPHRAFGLEVGLDAVQPVGKGFSLLWEIASVKQMTDDPSQLYVTFGVQRDFGERFALSAIAYYGFLEEGDRLGVLFGISPKTKLF
ncbi:MAG: hypothetical protein ACXVEE_12200 [Polyangiales bacterium]